MVGSICWTITNSLFNPLDVLRIRWQVTKKIPLHFFRFTKTIIHTEGLFYGLWLPGMLAQIKFVIICGAVRLGSYQLFRDNFTRLIGKNKKSGPLMALAGFCSGTTAYILSGPLFIVKNRMQAQSELKGPKTTILYELRQIFSQGIQKILSGSIILIIRGSLLACGNMFGYDYTKTFFKKKNILEDKPILHLFASINAAICLTILCMPTDVIMTNFANRSRPEMSILDVTRNIWSNGKIYAFYRGSQILFLRMAPSSMISLILYEQIRKILGLTYLD